MHWTGGFLHFHSLQSTGRSRFRAPPQDPENFFDFRCLEVEESFDFLVIEAVSDTMGHHWYVGR